MKYIVVEGNPPASGTHVPTPPDGYAIAEGVDVVSSSSLNVTNIALTKAFTAEKKYTDGSKPEVTFTLYRQAGEDGTPEAVPANDNFAVKVTLNGEADTPDAAGNGELTPWTYTWNNLPRYSGTYSAEGTEEYIYSVHEAPLANYTVYYGATANNAQVVSNTYVIPKGDVIFTKTWEGGPRPEISITLYRTPEGGEEENLGTVTLTGTASTATTGPRETTEDKQGVWTYLWPEMELTDSNGAWYTYRIGEEAPTNYTASDFSATGTTDENDVIFNWKVTVTNTYKSPETNALTATKKWVDGAEAEHTAPELTLWRKTADMAAPEKVTATLDADFAATAPTGSTATGTWSYAWQNVDTHRQTDGAPYTFYVTETGVPATYTLSLSNGETIGETLYGKVVNDTVTLTNTYASPTVALTLVKDFVNEVVPVTAQPSVVLTVYRKAGDVTKEEAVDAQGNKVTATTSTDDTTTWTVPVTDGAGNAYTYWVEEAFAAANVLNSNWKVEYASADGVLAAPGTAMELKVTNTLLPAEERTGKLTVKKALLVNEGTNGTGTTAPDTTGEQLTFPFKVVDPYGKELTITMELAPGGDAWVGTNLLYGEYTVVETDARGFTASYSPAGGKVTLTPTAIAAEVTITNTSTDTTTTSHTVTKQWVDGVTDDHTAANAPIYLYHKGVGGTQVKLPAATVVTAAVENQPGAFTFTWLSLPMYSDTGYKYVYGADEETAADGTITVDGRKYQKTMAESTITNTYVVPGTDTLQGTKKWDLTAAGELFKNPHEAKVNVWLQLWRTLSYANAAGEAVLVDEPAPVGTTAALQPVQEIIVSATDGKLTYTTSAWTNVASTDSEARPYSFYVKEVIREGAVWVDHTPLNFTKSYGDDGQDKMTVVNTLVLNGQMNLTKAPLVTEATGSANLSPDDTAHPPRYFDLTITGPYGYEENRRLQAGQTINLTGLAFGDYTITEKTEVGWTAAYDPEGPITVSNDPTKPAKLTITNTMAGQELKATKNWVGGALAGEHPQPVFSLWQLTSKGLVELTDAVANYAKTATAPEGITTQWVCTFENIARYDVNGRPFTYYIFEEKVDNYTQTFTSSETVGGKTYALPGSTITNTYSSPLAPVTATKEWDFSQMDTTLYPNIEQAKVDVWFKLQRKTAADTDFADVQGAEIKKVEAGTTSVTWHNMPETDGAGQTYIYAVQEVDAGGNDYTPDQFVKSGGQGTENSPRAVTLTNQMQKGTLTLTVSKALLDNTDMNGGHATSSETGTPITFTFTITGPWGFEQTFTLSPGKEKAISGLSAGTYQVAETNTQGYAPSYAPGQTVELTSEDIAVIITNSHADENDPNAIKVTAEKKWIGGAAAERTAVKMILSRSVDGTDFTDVEAVYTVTPETLGSSTYAYSWQNLPKHSPEGYPYTYKVREDGTEVLEGKTILKVGDSIYDVSQVGNTVTNTFRVQNEDQTAYKKWDFSNKGTLDPHAVDVWFHLYRKTPAGQPEKLTTEPVKMAANDAGTSYTWQDMPTTDSNGNKYTYYVREVNADGVEAVPLNFTADTVDDMVVTNTFDAEEARQGKLTLRKALIDNSALPGGTPGNSTMVGDNPLVFEFQVTGPYGYIETVSLSAGKEITIENLPYGEYKVEETRTHDYVPQYIPANATVNVAPGQLTPPVVEVKNNHAPVDDPNVVDVQAFKKWEGYDEGKPAPLTLMRAPGTPSETMPLMAVSVDPVIQDLGEGRYQYDWTNLPKHNPYGSEYTYTAVEKTFKLPGDANDYDYFMVDGRYYVVTHETAEDGVVTVTNAFKLPEAGELELPRIIKKLEGGTLKANQFSFTLSVADGATSTAKNDADGNVVFGNLSFPVQGEYTVTIREVNDGARNYIYDNTVYTINVKATTDQDNVLQLEASYLKDGEAYEGDFVFTNIREKDPVAVTSAPIQARVELIGRALKDKEFEFQLLDGANNVINTMRNGPDGKFSLGTQRFRRAGTYVYTIQQVKGTENGMHYDMEPIRVRITVREGRSGMLEVFMEFLLPTANASEAGPILTSSTTYTKAGVDVTSDPLLTNRVNIPPTGDKALVLPTVLLALSLSGLALWLLSKKKKEETA